MMNILQKNINKLGVAKLSAAVLALVASLLLGLSALAWGPERTTYTIEKPADRVTFNAITNNPNHGDERNFTLARHVSEASNQWRDLIEVKDDAEYIVRMYVHNNAAANYNLVAENTRAVASIPNVLANEVKIQGQIRADNATPKEVWDQVVFRSQNRKFNIAYITGSARYYTNVNPSEGFVVSDDLIKSNGALLGYDKLDGRVPGCFQYSGILTFKVKVQTQKQADFNATKQVRKVGQNDWQKTIKVKPGEKIEYRLGYDNVGEVRQNDIIVKDVLPKSISYTANSTYLKNATNPNGDGLHIVSNDLTTKGIRIGDYNPDSNAFVKFSAQVASEKDLACGLNRLVNRVYVVTKEGTKENTATVEVERECEEPIEVCELESKSIVSIEKKDFDSKRHSKNLSDCDQPVTVTELPQTGPATMIGIMLVIVATAIGAAYLIRNYQERQQKLESKLGEGAAKPKSKVLESHLTKTPKK